MREALPDLRAGEDDGAKDLNGADLIGGEEEEDVKPSQVCQAGAEGGEERKSGYHKLQRGSPGLVAVVAVVEEDAEGTHDEQLGDGDHHHRRLGMLVAPAAQTALKSARLACVTAPPRAEMAPQERGSVLVQRAVEGEEERHTPGEAHQSVGGAGA